MNVILRTFFLYCTILYLVSCNPPEMSTETGEISGEKVYQYYCTSCHGSSGDRQSGNASNLAESQISDDAIRRMILYGSKKGMASYQPLLKDEEIEALIEHVKSLRK